MHRLDRLSFIGSGAVLIAAATLAGCGGSKVSPVEPRTPAPVVETGPTVAASSSETTPPPVEVTPPELVAPPKPPELAGAELRRRYAVTTAKQTLTDDRGEGHDDLYGTRNVRAVLSGVFYRGGANNAFHRDGKRTNKNPLPADGLANLCHQGFGTAIYLYPTNYETAAKQTTCESVDGEARTLTYAQITSQHYKKSDLRTMFGMIVDTVREPERGAVYAHCWNGWHASGYVAAITLRQFCGFTGAQALRYWTLTAKGASNADHADTRDRITKYKPFPEYSLTAEERAALCPDPKTLKFAAPEPAP